MDAGRKDSLKTSYKIFQGGTPRVHSWPGVLHACVVEPALKHEGLLRRVDDFEAAGLLERSDQETPVAAVLGTVPGVPGSLSLCDLAHGRDPLSLELGWGERRLTDEWGRRVCSRDGARRRACSRGGACHRAAPRQGAASRGGILRKSPQVTRDRTILSGFFPSILSVRGKRWMIRL